jgi:hypothetical protein
MCTVLLPPGFNPIAVKYISNAASYLRKSELPRMVLSEYAFTRWVPAARWFLQNLGLFLQIDVLVLLDSMEHLFYFTPELILAA